MIPTNLIHKTLNIQIKSQLNDNLSIGFYINEKEQYKAYIIGKLNIKDKASGSCIAILHQQKEDTNALIITLGDIDLSSSEIENILPKEEIKIGHLIVKDPTVTRTHRGVYGIIIRDNKILLIRKARGPYTGLFDLPGGSPELNETPEQTVKREIKEETNCDLISAENKRTVEVVFSNFTKESQEIGVMQHQGILFDCKISGEASQKGDGLDSNGAVWIDINTLSKKNATPFTLMGIRYEG